MAFPVFIRLLAPDAAATCAAAAESAPSSPVPTFRYVAKTRSGERREGSLEASDARAAAAALSRDGLLPVSVRDASASSPRPAKAPKAKSAAAKKPSSRSAPLAAPLPGSGRARMKMAELLLFTKELSDLLAGGMTLGVALHSLASRASTKAQAAILPALRDEIVAGKSLSAALAAWPDTFPTLYVSMVRAGEASGQLPSVLEHLVTHFQRVQGAREKVTTALVYPVIVAVIGIGAMVFMMAFVIPRFSEMFEELGGTLPLPTRMMIALSHGTVRYGWLAAIAICALVVFLRRAFRTPAGRAWKDRALLRLPIAKGVIRASAFSTFASTLGTLLSNGVQVLPALDIVEKTISNSVIAGAIRETREKVTDGSNISRPLAQSGVFPPLLTDMLAVGEQTGNMPTSLSHIAARYENELDRAVKVLTTMLEPIMMLFIAVGVGFIAISMLMAVFEMTNGLNA